MKSPVGRQHDLDDFYITVFCVTAFEWIASHRISAHRFDVFLEGEPFISSEIKVRRNLPLVSKSVEVPRESVAPAHSRLFPQVLQPPLRPLVVATAREGAW